MSRVLPILFNTEMVRAILDGRKTVTRRAIKHNVDAVLNSLYHKEHPETPDKMIIEKLCMPPCQPGDILYVRESYKRNMDGYSGIDFGGYIYKADCPSGFKDLYNPWRPSIHMPKEVARIWLRCTDVRVERLQEITEEQAYREGVIKAHDDSFNRDYWYYKEGQNYLTGNVWTESARQCFLWGIWNGTLKKTDYDRYCNNANPWVWVIEFERCEKPEREE